MKITSVYQISDDLSEGGLNFHKLLSPQRNKLNGPA